MLPHLAVLLLAAGPLPTKIAVHSFEAGAGIDPQVAELVGSTFTSSLRRRTQLSVMSQDDLKALLGFERQKQLLNCSDTHCLAELAGALGVANLITGSVGRLGSVYVLIVRLIDVKHGKVIRDFDRRLTDARPEVLFDAVEAAITDLFPDALPPAPSAAIAPAASTEAASHHGPGLAPWIVAGAGAAVAIAGAIVLGVAAGGTQLSGNHTNLTYAQAQGINTEGEVGQGLLIGGAAVGVGGLAWALITGPLGHSP